APDNVRLRSHRLPRPKSATIFRLEDKPCPGPSVTPYFRIAQRASCPQSRKLGRVTLSLRINDVQPRRKDAQATLMEHALADLAPAPARGRRDEATWGRP